MKRLILTIATVCCILCICEAKNARKPVPLADPYILYDNGMYYLYGTHAADGIAVVMSDNMKDWVTPDGSGTYLALDKKNSYGEKMFWAPEVYKVGGRYIMFYSCQEHVCMAESKSPTGPFMNEGAPILEEKGIDNSLFIDEDGTPYMFWVRFDGGNVIWMAEMTPDFRRIKPGTERFVLKADTPWELDMGHVTEGPFCLKHDGRYYLTYSANDYRSQNYGIGVAVTDDLKSGKWEKSEDNPIFQKPKSLVGVGHHSFFTDRKGKTRIVFHSHNSDILIHPRLTHISKYKFKSRKGESDALVISPRSSTLYME